MITIKGPAGENWINYCKYVMTYGSKFYDDDEKIKELLDVILVFDNFDPKDKILNKFADKKLISLYRKKMETTKIVPELNSSYGKRLYDQLGVNQVEWLINRIKNKPETKAATISLLLPNDPGPRIPCLSIIDIKVREGRLHLTGFFRSQNATRSYGNFIAIHYLHKKIAKATGYPVGKMKFMVSSAHIYEKDINSVEHFLKKAQRYIK